MPYGTRVLAAVLGGVLLMAGVATLVERVARRAYVDDGGLTIAGIVSGLGLGLVATAFVRRD
ncbi:MAG TPA: hypothetical protein VF519_08830 [Mycobacteriales bacterium]|jgi:uncharacterized membrane protein HdeD (DUF308 family)